MNYADPPDTVLSVSELRVLCCLRLVLRKLKPDARASA